MGPLGYVLKQGEIYRPLPRCCSNDVIVFEAKVPTEPYQPTPWRERTVFKQLLIPLTARFAESLNETSEQSFCEHRLDGVLYIPPNPQG